MRKVLMLEHISLDGFLAGPHGEMDWIRVDEDLFDYGGALTDRSDTAIYGRKTFEMMAAYWPTAADQPGAGNHEIRHSRWYNASTKLVFSRSKTDSAVGAVFSNDIAGTIAELKSRPGKDLLLIGSAELAREFLRLRLVDELWLNLNPILLGSGIPLFDEHSGRADLRLASSHTFPSGVLALCYERAAG